MKLDKTFGEKCEGAAYYDREGAYLVAVWDGRVAVVHTPRGYFLPGGGLEGGEDHRACIRRECLEEMGYTVTVGEHIGSADVYARHERIGYFHPIQHYYAGALVEQSAAPIERDHTLVWLPVDGIEEKMYTPAQSWAIRRYLERAAKAERRSAF